MQIEIQKRFLNLPVRPGAPARRVCLHIEGQLAHEFDIELADPNPSFWTFLDLGPWLGKPASVEINPPVEGLNPADVLVQSDVIKDAASFYRESLRPQFHFTARRGWNNDPNGLLYYAGEYHMFFQHNPYGTRWGNMHWGHAVSPDLVHWQELPEALYPDDMGTMFSGSGVVAWHGFESFGLPKLPRNPRQAETQEKRGGLGAGGEPPLWVIYTAAGGTSERSQGKPFTQCLAYSLDRGRTWTKWAGNPVLQEIAPGNRDPKVVWHAATQKWIMALYLDGNRFALLASPDLQAWALLTEIVVPGSIECPDLFELPLDGNFNDTRWVFWVADSSYLVGRFDGKTFTQESLVPRSHGGGNSYAAQTWSDIPANDGRRIQISWLQADAPGMPFNQGMTFPVRLSLRRTEAGIRLFNEPVREIETLYRGSHSLESQALPAGVNALAGLEGELFDLQAEIDIGEAAEVRFGIRGVALLYDVRQEALLCQGRSLPLQPIQGKINIRALVDRTSIEIFANNGQVYLPLGVVCDPQNRTLELFARGGAAWIEKLVVHDLGSIWD